MENSYSGSAPDLHGSREEYERYVTNRKRKFCDDSFVSQLKEFSDRILSKLCELESRISVQNDNINALTLDMGKVMQQNDNIEKINESTKDAIENLAVKFESVQNRVDVLETNYQEMDGRLLNLDKQVEQLQRKLRANFLEIRQLPEKPGENLLVLVKKIAEVTKSNIELADIRDVHREKRGDNKVTIVEMNSQKGKINFLKSVKKFNADNKNNKLNATHIGFQDNTAIFVAEQLTQKAQRLHYLGRQLMKNNTVKYCWISGGAVLVRKSDDPNSPAIVINSEKQLKDMEVLPSS